MGGDYSKDSFDALKNFAGVLMQQGRAVLDSDWNEMVRIFERRIRAECVDTIGRAVVPKETPDGFALRIEGGTKVTVDRGTFYLNGYRLENSGLADFAAKGLNDADPPVFDRARRDDDDSPMPEGVLDEMISPPGGDALAYDGQPYWPTPDPLPGVNLDDDVGVPSGGPHLAYLVAWEREVTSVKMPELLEPALDGIDTTTRLQTVWQLRFLENVGPNTTCETPDEDIDGWLQLIVPSTARLTTDTIDIEEPEDPCLVPPTDGYTGVENQLYRVVLGFVSDDEDATQGDARFKFSRENASIVVSVESIANPANRINVSRIGRDAILAFRPGDWAEITDDHREFNLRSGRMLRISEVHPETREIIFEAEIDADGNDDLIPSGQDGDTLVARHTRLIRWDQQGEIRLANGDLLVDLDAPGADGLIPVPTDGTPVILESGITVSFSTAEGPGRYRDMDYWQFYARTAGTQIQRLNTAPPDGIQRHYAKLAVVSFPESVQDCRVFWPPDFAGDGQTEPHSCGCTVCVTAEEHNSGALTIQAAIDQVGALGGTVCLEAGFYGLTAPIKIDGRNAIKIQGQGLGTLLTYFGTGGAIRLSDGFDIELCDFAMFVIPEGEDDVGAPLFAHGVTAMNTGLLAYDRLAVVVFSGDAADRTDLAFAFDGIQLDVKVSDCLAIAPFPIASRASLDLDEQDDPVFVAFLELRVRNNILIGLRDGVHFTGPALNVADAVFAGNLVTGDGAGMRINLADLPTGATVVDTGTVQARGVGLALGASDVRVRDCEIRAETGDGIRLDPSLVPEIEQDARISGNSIFEVGRHGIYLSGTHGAVNVADNILRNIGGMGVFADVQAEIAKISIAGNTLEDLATAEEQAAAIALTSGGSVGIAGNAIRRVGIGNEAGDFYGGIAVQGVGELRITDNVLSEIGPDQGEVVAVSILVMPPYLDVIVSSNQVLGRSLPATLSGWSAIEIGRRGFEPGGDFGVGPNAFTAAVPGVNPDTLAFVAVGRTVFRITETLVEAVAPLRSGLIGVRGNQCSGAMRLQRPFVMVADGGSPSLDFSQNQLQLLGRNDFDPIVQLVASRMTASSNTVIHAGDVRSIEAFAVTATLVGNITATNITLNGAVLPAPFDTLNLNG